jgi:hypothetical protein
MFPLAIRAGHPQGRPACFFSPILRAMMKLCRGSLVALLLAFFAGCSGGDAEKGIIKNKDKPVPPAAQTPPEKT